jgi:CDP-glycerol glycerophosphotransferase (TagB/SpsB family)
MNNDQFIQATKLYDYLGAYVLEDGRTVRDAFCLVGNVSLWDCLSTYLVLYRLPLCILSNAESSTSYIERARPMLGSVANLYDTVIRPPKFSNIGLEVESPDIKVNNILFLGFNTHHFRDVLQSVHHEMEEVQNYKPVVLTSARKGYYRHSYLSVWDCMSSEVIKSTADGLSSLKDLKRMLLRGITPGRYEVPTGFLIDWVSLRRELCWLCNREIPRLLYIAAAVNKVLSFYAPLLIVTADDADQKSKLVELSARELGIPSLVIQQGITQENYPDWRHFAGDYVAVMSSKSLETIISQGVPRNALTITGHPGYDKLKKTDEKEILVTRSTLGFNSGDFVVIFATQPYTLGVFTDSETRDEIIREICETISSIVGVNLVIKAHPYDSIDTLRRLSRHCKNTQIVGGELEIAGLIKATDLFVTMFSQTTLEALYAGKPVINVKFPGILAESPFYDGNATLLATSRGDIEGAIIKLVNKNFEFFHHPNQKCASMKLLENWIYRNDGQATHRIIKLIDEILSK